MKFVFDTAQRFACKDCPARCCRLPAAIRLNEEEKARLLAEGWLTERAGPAGAAWLHKGVLPVREAAGQLQCVFLDDDARCSIQKKHGHDFLPQACQSFPFSFVKNEHDELVAQNSLVCPSIRDGYGEALGKALLEAKLEQGGGCAERMSKVMGTRHGHVLTQKQYLRVVARWLELMGTGQPATTTLMWLYDWTRAFEDALPAKVEKPDDETVEAAVERAGEQKAREFNVQVRAPFAIRMFFSYVLGGLCHPARVAVAHNVDRPGLAQKLRALITRLKWVFERGEVDLLHVPRPVRLDSVDAVQRLLSTEQSEAVLSVLRRVLEGRRIFTAPRHLMSVMMDLALAAAVIARYARCRAASEGRQSVEPPDIAEGISAAELVLLGHASLRSPPPAIEKLRRRLIGDRLMFMSLLASEA